MSEFYNKNQDRRLSSRRSFRGTVYRIVGVAAILLGAFIYYFWGFRSGAKEQQLLDELVSSSKIKRVENTRLADARIPALEKVETENVVQEETPWAAQLRSLRELAAIAPDEAIARIAAIDDKHERKAAVASVCPIIAATDPAKAMYCAWALELGRFSDEAKEIGALETIARKWAEVDPAPALKWVSALPLDEESRRDHVVRSIASVLAHDSPDIAAELVVKSTLPDGSVQLDATLEVLRHWAVSDRQGALKWVERLEAGSLRDRSLVELNHRSTEQESMSKGAN